MKRIKKPWFTDDCKQTINQRKKALRNLRNHPPPISIDSVSAEPKLVVRCEKQNVSLGKTLFPELTPVPHSRRIWNMLHKIQGNDIFQPVKHLKVNNNSITDTKEIANTLANTIAYNSSSNHSSSTFQSHKTICEKMIFVCAG